MKKHIWKWVLLLVAVIGCTTVADAKDIYSAKDMDDAIGDDPSDWWKDNASYSGNIVTLLRDVTNLLNSMSERMDIKPGADIIFNLNGHSIRNKDRDLFRIETGGKLTIIGSGSAWPPPVTWHMP